MNFDLIVIGSGPGGYVAAIRAAQLGLKTAIVEKENLGGICSKWGCIPTKALLKSAKVFSDFKNLRKYGLSADKISINFTEIIQRSREIAEKMSKGVSFLMSKNKINVILGTAKIAPGKKVIVTPEKGKSIEYTAPHIIIATGSRSKVLPNLPQDGKKIIGYRQALVLKELPQRMLVVGSGAIGVEFAYFYNTLGTKVTLVENLPRIVPFEDKEISAQLEKSLKKQGINIFTNSFLERIDFSSTGVNAFIKLFDKTHVISSDIVLSAVGITPNIDNIGLEKVGIILDKGRIIVDDFYRTNIEGYYAIGDLINSPALAHVASAEGVICVDKIKNLNTSPLDYKNIPSCIYCDPEIASVGLTEEQAINEGLKIKIGKFPIQALGKANADGYTEGFIKVIFDAKYGEWLGCHLIGTGVSDLISEVVVARNLETTAHEILNTIHPHPSLSEGIKEAISSAYGECIHL